MFLWALGLIACCSINGWNLLGGIRQLNTQQSGTAYSKSANPHENQAYAPHPVNLSHIVVPCRPGEFIYQIDLLPGRGLCAGDYEGYVEFMHDTGVEVLQRWGRWVYLRGRAEEGPFEIYTEIRLMLHIRSICLISSAPLLHCRRRSSSLTFQAQEAI